jgi:plastocyanin
MFILLALITTLVVACGGSNNSGNSSNSNTVDLAASAFAQSSVTITKGSSLTLNNSTATVHIIANGNWNNNTPDPKAEPGAPVVNNLVFNSANQTQDIGPFNTAGTFHFYCSVHPGMNLTVTVQ